MKIDIEKLPKSREILQKIILDLQETLQQKETDLQKKENDLQQKQNELAELISYKEKYHHLLEEIRLARQHIFSPSSEKNVLQAGLFDEAGEELSAEVKEQLEEDIEVGSYTRKKHPIRCALPKELSREHIIHDISDAEKICDCGAALQRIGEEITEQLKFIPAQLSVVQHIRPKYACKPCEKNVKIAPMPILLLPKSIATPELVAHTIIAKYCDHLPLYRQESIWRRFDIDLPRSSLCGWILKTAELCSPLIALLRTNIISQDYMQADETTVQVLDEVGRENTKKSYMWVYKSGELSKPSIVFDYQETRSGCHARDFIQDFKGFLQTDAYVGYGFAQNDDNIISIGCMAHARRPFAKLVKLTKTPGLAHEALKFFKKLYAIEEEARKNNLSAIDRYHLRNSKAPPILDAFKLWLEHYNPKLSEESKLSNAMKYVLKHWESLTNYLKDGRIEIDNNALENKIRPFAVGRKNWLFMGSPAGAKAGAILYSLIETCKANHIEPYKYFCAMLPRIRLCKTSDDYRQLLPQFIQF